MVHLGLLGAGRIGKTHARTTRFLDDVQLVAVSDAVPEAAEALAKDYGCEVRTSDAIIAADDIDAVLICTPTTTHFDLIHQACDAGKAIFCEKPIDLDIDRTRACVDKVEASGVPFFTAFNRRFDPQFAHAQAQIASGAIGNVEMVTILSRDPSPPPISYIEQSGGLFRDMMIHDFDMARFLLGEDPVEVFATGSSLVDPTIGAAGDVDTASATLRTASGKIATITNSRRATYGYDQRAEIHCSAGMLRVENRFEHAVQTATARGFATAPTLNFFLERYEDAYRIELGLFAEAIKDGTPVRPNARDGLVAQAMAEAAVKSLKSGRAEPVQAGTG